MTDPDLMHPPPRQGWWRRMGLAAAFGSLIALTIWVITVAVSGGDSSAAAAQQVASPAPGEAIPAAAPVDPIPQECPPSADACVDTRLRISWLQHDGEITYGPVPVMPGESSKWATPQGTFHVEWKSADWVSTEFDEPMPNSVFFAPGGIAFHQGPLAESSHGCVHLSGQASQFYYDHLPVGAEVVVFGGYPPQE